MGGRGYGGRGRGRLYTYRYTVTIRMTCIKMGSDESHFNVSLTARDKVTRQCPQTTTFLKSKESRTGIERGPSTYKPNALPLGQTDSYLQRFRACPLITSVAVSSAPPVTERGHGFVCIFSVLHPSQLRL